MSDEPSGGPTVAQRGPVLVLHASIDEAFVRGYLRPALGEVRALDATAASAGDLEREIRDGVTAIVVLTPAFVADPWTRLVELVASRAAMEGGRRVLPLLLEDCALPERLNAVVPLDFRTRAHWDRGAARLRKQLERPAPAPEELRCPYPGMRPFEAGEAGSFFGRTAEIDEVLAQLDAGERELYVLGPSGSGKSSLIAAGVLPRLAARAEAATIRSMRPGDTPSRRLAEALLPPPPEGGRLVLFIDQLEELFTQAPAAEQAAFAAALAPLRADPRTTLLFAARADFFAELLESELWAGGARHHIDLLPLRGAALREAIERPARALEVYFEPGLTDRLLSDAAGEPGVLPLLQETLVQLWSQRRHRLLTTDAYTAMGDAEGGRSGLAVAISSRAARCLDEMAPNERVIARRVLLRMVSFGEGRPNTRRRQTRTALGAAEPATQLEGVLRRLVAARLVTMDRDDRSGDDRVELCHEILVTAWPAFASWVEARRADEQRRRQFQASADEWLARGRGEGGLLDKAELATAVAWRGTDAARELGESAEVTALVAASQRALGAARRRRLALGAGLAAIAAGAIFLAVVARDRSQTADVERARSARLLAEQLLDTGRQLVIQGHDQRAIPYLVAARQRGDESPALHQLFRAAARNGVAFSLRPGGAITSANFSSDGAHIVIATEGPAVRIWDAATGAPRSAAAKLPGQVRFAGKLPDGRIIAVGDGGWIWDPAAAAAPPLQLPGAQGIDIVTFTPDGKRIVTGEGGRLVRVWDGRTGRPVSPPIQHGGFPTSVDISSDGARVLTADSGSEAAMLWDAVTGVSIGRLEHKSRVKFAAFSPDGTQVVTTTGSSSFVWDLETKTQVFELAHPHEVDYVLWSRDGTLLVTATERGAVYLWNAKGGSIGDPLVHPQRLSTIELSNDGRRLLTACLDKSVRVWDTERLVPVALVELEGGASSVSLSADGKRVLTAGADGLARIWEAAAPATRTMPLSETTAGGYGPGAAYIAGVTYDRLRLWNPDGSPRASLDAGKNLHKLAMAPGRLAAIQGLDLVQIWDTETLRPLPAPEGVGRKSPGVVDLPSFGFSPDGKRFAATARAAENTARIYDTDTGAPLTPPLEHGERIATLRFSPDGARLVSAALDGTARIWDAATGAPASPPLPHPGAPGLRMAIYSPDGARIATVSGRTVKVWDAASLRPLATLEGHGDQVMFVAFSPDSRRIATAGWDRTAWLWDAATGALLTAPLEHAEYVVHVAFSADGTRLATSGGFYAQLWDAATGRPVTAPLQHPATVRQAEVSPDGAALLTVAFDGLRLWDIGADQRSLDEWRAIAAAGSFSALARSLGVLPSSTPP